MPKLQELYLEFDGGKTGSLTEGEFDFGIQHLPCLALVRSCFGYSNEARGIREYGPEHPAWDALKKAVSSNPRLCFFAGPLVLLMTPEQKCRLQTPGPATIMYGEGLFHW